ncbi:hypothetical protein QW131_19740 [Roseibium salinum]|nr:hypothetical protein [Roseibium salinum]
MSLIMRILRCAAVLCLVLVSLTPVLAQDAATQDAAPQESAPADLKQASDALIKVLNDPQSREALVELLKRTGSEAQSGAGDSTVASSNGAGQAAGGARHHRGKRIISRSGSGNTLAGSSTTRAFFSSRSHGR